MAETRRVALIVGVTGISGLNLAKKMLSTDQYGHWTVYGLSRKTSEFLPAEVRHVSCDLLDAAACKERLAPLSDVTHVFYTTWIKKGSETENMKANVTMLENLLDNLATKPQHVTMQTGLRHYLTVDPSVKDKVARLPTPFKESYQRPPGQNFVHTQQDILSQRAEKDGFTWSVVRPGCIIGFAPLNQINLGASMAVYAAICKYSGWPFAFPGTRAAYNALLSITDAEILAEHHLWQATEAAARNEAFNVANGDLIRIGQMWKLTADAFDLEVPEPSDTFTPVATKQKEMEPIWKEMVEKFDLKPLGLDEVATLWALAMLNLGGDFFGDLSMCRERGFLVYQDSEKTFHKLFQYLRDNKFIPGKTV